MGHGNCARDENSLTPTNYFFVSWPDDHGLRSIYDKKPLGSYLAGNFFRKNEIDAVFHRAAANEAATRLPRGEKSAKKSADGLAVALTHASPFGGAL